MYDCETVLLLLNVKGNMKNRNMFKICFSYISFSVLFVIVKRAPS